MSAMQTGQRQHRSGDQVIIQMDDPVHDLHSAAAQRGVANGVHRAWITPRVIDAGTA
jgi:hypothetical protein